MEMPFLRAHKTSLSSIYNDRNLLKHKAISARISFDIMKFWQYIVHKKYKHMNIQTISLNFVDPLAYHVLCKKTSKGFGNAPMRF